MSKQVLSIEQMNHLRKLGIDTSNASFVKIEYDEHDGENRHLISILVEENHCLNDDSIKDSVNVYTLQDILDLLDMGVNKLLLYKSKKKYICLYIESCTHSILNVAIDKEPIEAVYNMLCWVIEHGYLK